MTNRRPSVNMDCGEGLIITVSFDPNTGKAHDVFLVGRGHKASDAPLNEALYEAGVRISKIIQGDYDD